MYKPKSLVLNNILSWEDVSFNFKQGQSVIIVGDNRDDPGQRGNGSGKSGLTEGVVIAVTGSVIRPIKNKEIVRRGTEYGEVELILHNERFNSTLKIWRKIYSGTKSAEYALYENGKECCEHYSDLNSFNSFVFEKLGISKEDFYSFFVLEKTTTPFLLMGDTEKKKVVNRFSGAVKVDLVFPLIEADLLKKKQVEQAIEQEIASNKGKRELLADQIVREQNKYSKESLNKEISSLTESKKEIEDKRLRTAKKIADSEQLLQQAKNDLKVHSSTLTSYQTEQVAIRKKIEEADKSLKITLASVKSIRDDVSEAESLIAEIKNSLAGVIECPKCAHEFKLQQENFNIQEARQTLLEIEKEILPQLRKEYEDAVRHQTTQQESISQYEKQASQLRTLQAEFDKQTREKERNIASIVDDITRCERVLKSFDYEIEELDKKINNIREQKSTVINDLTSQLEQYVKAQKILQDKLQKAADDTKDTEKWIVNFKSFKSHLANRSIANIQDYCNIYLQQMQTNIRIVIEGYKTLANKKIKEEITTFVRRNGVEDASYGSFSGGEKGRIDICTIVAIQTLINLNSPTGGLDLLILDEVMDSVDSLGLENIIGALQGIDRTIMIVSQNEINSLSEYTIRIQKQNRVSKIINN